MKCKKENGLAFEKKALTELQKEDSINADGGHITAGAVAAATRRVQEILKHRYTE